MSDFFFPSSNPLLSTLKNTAIYGEHLSCLKSQMQTRTHCKGSNIQLNPLDTQEGDIGKLGIIISYKFSLIHEKKKKDNKSPQISKEQFNLVIK